MVKKLETYRGGLMTIHVLISCSASKRYPVSITWSVVDNLTSWKEKWDSQGKKYPIKKIYSGRTIKIQLDAITQTDDVKGYFISAGGGLMPIDDKMNIPSYDSTFIQGKGPTVNDWHKLPIGGLKNINMESGDSIVSFAPPKYHRSIAKDPYFSKIKGALVVGSNSPLSKSAGTVIPVHPRSRDILGGSFFDINARLLAIYLNEGGKGLAVIFKKAENLPSLAKKNKLTNLQLNKLVAGNESTLSLQKLVVKIRASGYSASYERIKTAKTNLSRSLGRSDPHFFH